MSNPFMREISPDHLSRAEEKGAREIFLDRRRAATMRTIAAALNGAYVTKKLEPKLMSIIHDVKRVYIHRYTYGNYIELHVSYRDEKNYNECDEINLCDITNRRIDGEQLRKRADDIEKRASEKESFLDSLPDTVDAYNELADQYSRIYKGLSDFFYDDIPFADSHLVNAHRDDPLPEPAPAPEPAASREPRILMTLDEFSAAHQAFIAST